MPPIADSRSSTPTPVPQSVSKPRGRPVMVLLLIAPFIAEVLYGATRISVIFVFIPEIMTWGCGALLIREWVRRCRKGWSSMLLLGLALAVAEEFIIQQTSIAPLVGLAKHAYGRVWGVNWVYFLWALGYESVWVVLVPVQLTELLFPERRDGCWLRARGIVVATVIFVVGSFMAWYGWTQRARVQVFHMPPYSPPSLYLLSAAGVILLLIASAFALPPRSVRKSSAQSPAPWLVGTVVCFLATPWAAFVLLGFGSFPKIPFQAVLVAGAFWAGLTFFLMQRWTSSANWGDSRRFAVVFGGVLACMLGGFAVFKVGGALRMDWIGKAVLNVAGLAWLIWVGRAVQRR